MDFIDAQEPRKIAKDEFIGEGKAHWHLKDCNILWLYQDAGNLRNGYSISRTSKLWHHITGFDVVVRVLVSVWEEHKMERREVAFIDHLLSHIELNDNDVYVIKHPAVQEFIGVVQRHGAWRQPVNEMVQAQRNAE